MATTPLNKIAELPNKCPLESIEGKVIAVYESKIVNAKPKQDFVLQDASGTEVRCCAWEHDDLSLYKGFNVIINTGPKGGLAINEWNNKKSVNLSKTCTIQKIQMGGAPQPQAASPATIGVAGKPSNSPILGQTIGMAINNACNYLTATNQPLTKQSLWQTASTIVEVAKHMEAGNLWKPKEAVQPAPAPTPAPAPAPTPSDPTPSDEDVPF